MDSLIMKHPWSTGPWKLPCTFHCPYAHITSKTRRMRCEILLETVKQKDGTVTFGCCFLQSPVTHAFPVRMIGSLGPGAGLGLGVGVCGIKCGISW